MKNEKNSRLKKNPILILLTIIGIDLVFGYYSVIYLSSPALFVLFQFTFITIILMMMPWIKKSYLKTESEEESVNKGYKELSRLAVFVLLIGVVPLWIQTALVIFFFGMGALSLMDVGFMTTWFTSVWLMAVFRLYLKLKKGKKSLFKFSFLGFVLVTTVIIEMLIIYVPNDIIEAYYFGDIASGIDEINYFARGLFIGSLGYALIMGLFSFIKRIGNEYYEDEKTTNDRFKAGYYAFLMVILAIEILKFINVFFISFGARYNMDDYFRFSHVDYILAAVGLLTYLILELYYSRWENRISTYFTKKNEDKN